MTQVVMQLPTYQDHCKYDLTLDKKRNLHHLVLQCKHLLGHLTFKENN